MVEKPTPRLDPAPRATSHSWQVADVIRSFRYAISGIYHLFGSQRNAQIHAFVGCVAVFCGWFFGITRMEWAVLVLTCALVLVAEGANTAIEAVVDLATTEYHPLAKIAKDVGAGAVLLAALAAVVVGLLIFVPYLLAFLQSLLAS